MLLLEEYDMATSKACFSGLGKNTMVQLAGQKSRLAQPAIPRGGLNQIAIAGLTDA